MSDIKAMPSAAIAAGSCNVPWPQLPDGTKVLPYQPQYPTPTVNPNPHYQADGLQAMDVLDAFGLDKKSFRISSAVKYLLRLDNKGGPEEALKDLAKVADYALSEIAYRKGLRGAETMGHHVQALNAIDAAAKTRSGK